MRCRSGYHEWLDQIDADRCCDPAWQRITILPGERIRDVLEDPRVARDGINYSTGGFRFAWLQIADGKPPELGSGRAGRGRS
jgi:hypothetical protein